MAYYVDTGDGRFLECATISDARQKAEHALQAARDFRARMGWTPFWGRMIEIRKGRANLVGLRSGEHVNQEIVAATKTHDVLYLKD